MPSYQGVSYFNIYILSLKIFLNSEEISELSESLVNFSAQTNKKSVLPEFDSDLFESADKQIWN